MAERAHPDHGFKDKYFGLKKNPYKKALFERYKFCNKYVAGKVVIDIPSGTGWGTSLIEGAEHITGIDIDAESVGYAKNNYGKENIEFKVGNMQSIDLPDHSIDVLICLEGLEHVPRDVGYGFIEETHRLIKPGGIIILTCPIIVEGGAHSGNPYHLYEYPELELLELLNANYFCIRIEEIETPDNPIIRFVGTSKKGAQMNPSQSSQG